METRALVAYIGKLSPKTLQCCQIQRVSSRPGMSWVTLPLPWLLFGMRHALIRSIIVIGLLCY